jgi:hypothetical protein
MTMRNKCAVEWRAGSPHSRTPSLFDLPALKKIGANQYGESNGVDNVHSIPANQLNSNSQERIVRRLKRDHQAHCEALQRGDYPSPRAAGIAAGFVKEGTVLDKLQRLWTKASQQEREAFLAWVEEDQITYMNHVGYLKRRGPCVTK